MQADDAALDAQLMLAESVQMIFSTESVDGVCEAFIARANAHCSNAWEASRERGTLGWRPCCKAKWPETMADLIGPRALPNEMG